MGYELLENDLTDSTLWMYRSDPARILAITIISKCNGSDRVYVPPAILIERARLSPVAGAAALAELSAPDPNSKCQLEQGRFIVDKVDDDGNRYLWLPSYAGRRRRYLARERQRLKRERDAEASRSVTPPHDASPSVTASHDVTRGHKPSHVDQNQNQNQSRAEQKGERARFAPPTLEEVQAYAREIPGLNAEAFLDFYASKGWKVGTQPMKDWKAAARNWRRRDGENGKIPPPGVEDRRQAQGAKDAEAQRLAEIEIQQVEKDRATYETLKAKDPAAAARFREEVRKRA